MKRLALFLLASFFCLPALAAPPIWETSFGPVISGLTGDDDDQESVSLSFSFPFDGNGYTTIWVGTNGDLQLGSLGDDGDIDYDHWQYMEEFVSDNAPSIAGLNTDLDLSTTGTIHFNDFGDRAVFTWDEVGTNENETALSTFQIQLLEDGTIILGYNGILDGAGEDLIDDMDEGFVVGITAGLEPTGTDPHLRDLTTAFFSGTTEVFERWCYDTVNSCGYSGDDNGWPGPLNTAFDLDQKNVVFNPTCGGYKVSSTIDSEGNGGENGEPGPDLATFCVHKEFWPDNSMPVEVSISCNDGLPLDSQQAITENSEGVVFVVELFTPGNLDCEVTEVPVPAGYNDSYDAGIENGDLVSIGNTDGCQFNGVFGGEFSCTITNTAQDATFEVNKVWNVIGEGGDLIDQEMGLAIGCTEAIKSVSPGPDYGPDWYDGVHWTKWSVLEGDVTATVTVDAASGTAACSAQETIFSDAVVSDNACSSDQSLTMGQTTSCTITNTVFFEGIPTLNRYGLALMALLMLGVGLLGFRRFA